MRFSITCTRNDISVYELEEHGFKISRVDEKISVIVIKNIAEILRLAEITDYDIIISPSSEIGGAVGNLEIYDGYRE